MLPAKDLRRRTVENLLSGAMGLAQVLQEFDWPDTYGSFTVSCI